MSNRPTRDDWAMSIAKITAKQSTCKRRAVGADAVGDVVHDNSFAGFAFVGDAR